MDEEGFKKTCIREKKKRGDIHQPFYGTWVADFMQRQDVGRFMLGKYLSDKKIPWRRRRRLGMAVAGKPYSRVVSTGAAAACQQPLKLESKLPFSSCFYKLYMYTA